MMIRIGRTASDLLNSDINFRICRSSDWSDEQQILLTGSLLSMKTKEELNAIKNEVETVSKKLNELTEEDLAQVAGGAVSEIGTSPSVCPDCGCKLLYQQGPYIVQNKTAFIYKCSECPWISGYCY